jgi:hypothetical protein
MKFSTNAKCGGCKAAIINGLQEKFPDARWSLDLESADKVLEVDGLPENAGTAARVEAAIAETGFKGSWLRQPGY